MGAPSPAKLPSLCPRATRKRRRQEEGVLCHLHLQGAEASSPRHWRVFQGHEHHELFRQRSLREDCCRGKQAGPLQQAVYYHLSGDTDCCKASVAWRVGQACSLRGHQGRDQVHQLQVDSGDLVYVASLVPTNLISPCTLATVTTPSRKKK